MEADSSLEQAAWPAAFRQALEQARLGTGKLILVFGTAFSRSVSVLSSSNGSTEPADFLSLEYLVAKCLEKLKIVGSSAVSPVRYLREWRSHYGADEFANILVSTGVFGRYKSARDRAPLGNAVFNLTNLKWCKTVVYTGFDDILASQFAKARGHDQQTSHRPMTLLENLNNFDYKVVQPFGYAVHREEFEDCSNICSCFDARNRQQVQTGMNEVFGNSSLLFVGCSLDEIQRLLELCRECHVTSGTCFAYASSSEVSALKNKIKGLEIVKTYDGAFAASVWDFLALLGADQQPAARVHASVAPRLPSTSYAAHERHIYLSRQLELEKTASSLIYFTKTLPNGFGGAGSALNLIPNYMKWFPNDTDGTKSKNYVENSVHPAMRARADFIAETVRSNQTGHSRVNIQILLEETNFTTQLRSCKEKGKEFSEAFFLRVRRFLEDALATPHLDVRVVREMEPHHMSQCSFALIHKHDHGHDTFSAVAFAASASAGENESLFICRSDSPDTFSRAMITEKTGLFQKYWSHSSTTPNNRTAISFIYMKLSQAFPELDWLGSARIVLSKDTIVANKYRLLKGTMQIDVNDQLIPVDHAAIAKGGALGAGIVYSADTLADPKQRVVLKFILPNAQNQAQELIHLARLEANTNLLLCPYNCPYICRFIEFIESDPDCPVLVFEHCSGQPLKSGKMHLKDVLTMGTQMLSAIETMVLAGVVHRDISPRNILWSQSEEKAKLIDFGISKTVDGPTLAAAKYRQTADFAAPEISQSKQSSFLSDIYALGRVLLFCLDKQAINKSIVDDLQKACSENPSSRFPSIDSMMACLQGHLQQLEFLQSQEDQLVMVKFKSGISAQTGVTNATGAGTRAGPGNLNITEDASAFGNQSAKLSVSHSVSVSSSPYLSSIDLFVLGVGNGTSAIFEDFGLGCGRAFREFFKNTSFPSLVYISHNHSDHSAELPPFIARMSQEKRPVTVFAHEAVLQNIKQFRMAELKNATIDWNAVPCREDGETILSEELGLSLRVFRSQHSEFCAGFVLRVSGHPVLAFTGDSGLLRRESPPPPHDALANEARGAVMLIDARSTSSKEHASYAEAEEFIHARRADGTKFYIYHHAEDNPAYPGLNFVSPGQIIPLFRPNVISENTGAHSASAQDELDVPFRAKRKQPDDPSHDANAPFDSHQSTLPPDAKRRRQYEDDPNPFPASRNK